MSYRTETISSQSGRGGLLRSLLTPALCVLVLVSLIFGGVFARLAEEVHESETLSADQRALRTIDDHTASWPVAIANDVSLLGAEVTVAVVGIAVAAWCALRRRWLDALLFLGAVGGYATLTLLMKHLVRRERPIAFFRVPESGYGFPSGHTLGATCLAFALGFLLWRCGAGRGVKIVGTVALALGVCAIALSRLMLGVHYPTDVLGSLLLGTAWMCALIAVRCTIERWRAVKTAPASVAE